MRRVQSLLVLAVLAVLAVVATIALPARAATEPVAAASPVPVPTVEGPITGGSRTGNPYWATPFDLTPYGYVEEEYLISGTASDRGNPETLAPYKVRMLIRRPTDPARFNGCALLEWANVSLQMEVEHDWPIDWAMLMREGFVSATVSAQMLGIQGIGPGALKNWDPQRYGSLSHPGDTYSYDIFAQAAQALRSGLVVNGLPVHIVLGAGTSQSCLRLVTYIPQYAERDGVFDGFHPTLCPATDSIPDNLVPIVWADSETEGLLPSRADGPLLRIWELAGSSHFNY